MYDEQVSSVRLSRIAPKGRNAKSTDRVARPRGVQVKCLGTREPIREVLRLARFGEVLDPVEGTPEAIIIVHLVGARWGASDEGKLVYDGTISELTSGGKHLDVRFRELTGSGAGTSAT